MDMASVLGLDSDRSAAIFGRGASRFLAHLNHAHPDLSRDPFGLFLGELKQISRCVSFCVDNGLDVPINLIRQVSPKFHSSFFSACRLLDQTGRNQRRRSKSPIRFDFGRLASDLLACSPDLPSSFGRFKSPRGEGADWSSMEADFRALGLRSMAAAAREVASEFTRDDFGLVGISARRAFLVLGKKMGIWTSKSEPIPLLIPACSVLLPEWCRSAIEASEFGLMGHPLFDHHVVLSFVAESQVPDSISADFVVLGERDGRFYFLASD